MRKSIYSTLFVLLALFSACNDENIPSADFDTMEASALQAVAGDEEVSLSWEALEGSTPSGYYLSWTAGSLAVSGGELSVESGVKTTTVAGLVNGETYTFSVQPVYANGNKGGKISVKAKPASTRIAATNLIAAAGDGMVRLKWTAPQSETLKEYKLLVSSVDNPIVIAKGQETYTITELTNDTEYEFTLICVYPNGTSDAISAKATPGLVYPVIVLSNVLTINEPCTFTWNDMYFMGTVQSVSWNFGDGSTSAEDEPVHSFAATGSYTVEVTIIYEDGTSEKGTIVMTVSGYTWESMELNYNGLSGYVKASNPVFSPDGRTAYIPTSSPNGHLFAIDVVKGTVKWVFQISTVTYGGGALVDADGIIYQCGTDSKVYAINPDGTGKWTCSVDGVIGAFPALSSTGVLYCATNSGTLYAIDAASGSVKWSKATGGTSSAVAVDASGNVYTGTNSAIYKFNASGTEQWKTSGTLNVTERGAFAIDAGGTTLYVALKANAGLSAIDMATGDVKWTYANAGGSDAYFPIAGPDGTIYFNEKGGTDKKVYAVNSDGSLKWEKNLGASLTYCGLVMSDDGKIYCGTQAKTGNVYKLYGLDAATGNISFTYDSEQQLMATASIGLDKRLYIGTIGSGNIGSLLAIPIEAGPETSSWSVRGGNIYGTNQK